MSLELQVAQNTGIEKSRLRKEDLGTLTEGSGQMLLEIRSRAGMWNHPPHLKRRLHSQWWARQCGCTHIHNVHISLTQSAGLPPLRFILVQVESCKNLIGKVLSFSAGPRLGDA